MDAWHLDLALCMYKYGHCLVMFSDCVVDYNGRFVYHLYSCSGQPNSREAQTKHSEQ